MIYARTSVILRVTTSLSIDAFRGGGSEQEPFKNGDIQLEWY
jgi:hypothetical protein